MANIAVNQVINQIDLLNTSDILPWAAVLMNSMQSILNVLKEVETLNKKVVELDSYAKVCKHTSDLLRADMDNALRKIKLLEDKLDDHEQRSRNQCLLFHGIEEREDEDTDTEVINLCANHLGIDLDLNEIARSHRLGPKRDTGKPNTRQTKKDEKSRPIIIRFSNFRVRQKLFTSKKRLKGKAFSITENLTKSRMDLLRKANDKLGKGKCWTQEGRIFTKIGNYFKVISSQEDL